jgi:hypothetical protein
MIVLAAGVSLAPAGVVSARSSGGPAEPAVLEAARRYVLDYETKLTFVLADEKYVQQIRDQVPLESSMPQGRTMKSQVYYIVAPQTGTWMSVRDVVDVDGQPVKDRPDLLAMLATTPISQVDATIKTRNARFNIGRTIRTFNEPTLALQVLEPSRAPSIDFRVTGTRTDRGVELSTLTFREHGTSTLLHDLQGHPALSAGEITVETKTGVVRKTTIAVRIDPVAMNLTTDYARDKDLDLWVPSALHERYEQGIYGSGADSRVRGSGHEEVRCEATYSNFHRFEVKGGIKK